MGLLTLFCVITVAFTNLTSGRGVLPDFLNGREGGSVMFTTSVTPPETPFTSIGWTFDDKPILQTFSNFIDPAYEDRITLFVSTGSLELRNLTLNDIGDYGVNILSTTGGGMTGRTTLDVIVPVSDVTVRANDTDLVEFSSSVSLLCSASGSPPLSFRWFKDSVELTASDRVYFTDGGATLIISTVWRSDHGSYSCEVSNSINSITSKEEELFVNYGPEDVILTPPPSDEFWEGTAVPLSCSADSAPPAQFTWFRNEEMLSSGAQINLVLEQSGNYSCQAFNSKTLKYTTSQPAEITVWEKIKNPSVKSSSPPIEGEPVNLTCDATGHLPSREWMLNGTELKPSDNINFHGQYRVLSFRELTRADNGKYTCNISNIVSFDTADYEMNVNYGPDSVQISGPVDVQEGTTLKLLCSADSVPTAKYTWTHNGTTVAQSSEYSKENIGLSDGGEYICRATNDVTMKSLEDSHAVNVTEKNVPQNPCPTGCIIGIVFGSIAAILLICGGVFFVLKKKKRKAKSSARTDGEGRDNSAYAQNQEVQYADVQFVKKDGGVVQLGAQNNNTEYSEVRRNNNAPGARLPTYNAHMQRVRRDEPETEYAQVRPK